MKMKPMSIKYVTKWIFRFYVSIGFGVECGGMFVFLTTFKQKEIRLNCGARK